jgi:hypothetical protein
MMMMMMITVITVINVSPRGATAAGDKGRPLKCGGRKI